MKHFNQRNATIVPELDRYPDCSFHFDIPTIIDSEGSPTVTSHRVWEVATDEHHAPCVLLGPLSLGVSRRILSPVAAFQIPLVNYFREDIFLQESRVVAGYTLSAEGKARAIVEYFSDMDHLAVWSSMSRFKKGFIDVLASESGHLEVQSVRVGTFQSTLDAMMYLRSTGIKTIYCELSYPQDLAELAKTLDDFGMLDNGKTFILPADIVPPDSVGLLFGEQEPDSPLDKLLSGALIFDRLDGFRASPDSDVFLQTWKAENSSTVAWMNKLVPNKAPFRAQADFFQSGDVPHYISYAYDAIIAVGMAGCIMEERKHTTDNSNTTVAHTDDQGRFEDETVVAPAFVPDGLIIADEAGKDGLLAQTMILIGLSFFYRNFADGRNFRRV